MTYINVSSKLVNKVPVCRYGSLEDLRDAVYYLAGDGSAYMTGGILQVDGAYVRTSSENKVVDLI